MASVNPPLGATTSQDDVMQAMQRIPGILDAQTLGHILDIELARARRYEHPFSVIRVRSSELGVLREVTGALRLHTRWADSVGVIHGAALLVVLRDTDQLGTQTALEKIRSSLASELSDKVMRSVFVEASAWRKGDDRGLLLARLDQ